MKFGSSLFLVSVLVMIGSACQTAAPPPSKSASVESSAPEKPIAIDTARNMANNCFTCHGPDGRSPGTIPSLNRLSAEKIAGKLKDFRSGVEPSTVMGRHTKAYTDAEIEAVASYIAGLNK